ncbi:alpha/beta hydrolase [bacterium]|nr:alpha/beta hydrolase [bacterium]
MKKRILVISVLVIVIVGLIYNFPVSSPTFSEIYQPVDGNITESLVAFRKSFPGKQVEIDGNSWKYLVTGSGKETILFLHGMTGAYDIWWQQILTLKATYRIVTLTYPPIDNLEALSSGIIKILEKEDVNIVHLVGSSLGGYLAQYLVAHHPGKIKSAIFANTFPPNDIIAEKNRVIGKLLPFIPEWAVMKVLRQNTDNVIYPAAEYSELVKAFLYEQSFGMMSKDQFVARFHCVIDPFSPPDTKTLGIPVMIIEADNDPLVELALREMLKQTYPVAKVKTLKNAGHFPYLSRPQAYTDLIEDFFQF